MTRFFSHPGRRVEKTLAAGKISDTVKKLSDFRSDAVTIGEAGKLDRQTRQRSRA